MSAQTPQRYDCMGDCRYDMVESTDGNYVRWGDYKLLRQWVTDLQSGMYVNCVYCGHRYGPGETTPVSMADALKEHVESCPQHPMSALKADRDRLRAEVERLTRERDEARKPPHCINCHCEESAKGMVDLSDYLDLHRGLMAVVYESKSHAEAVLFSERALRHAESEHVISEAASSAVASDPYADQNRALVAEIAARRGITLGHLREDGGCELAQIMRRLDAAEAEVERLRGAPHCPTCGCGSEVPRTPAP